MRRALLKPEELVRIFLGARAARLVRGALHHHRHPRPAGPRDGRSHHRARAAPRAAPLRRVHPREDGPGGRARADRAAHQRWPAGCRSTSRRPAAPASRRSRRKRASPPRSATSSRCAALVLGEREARRAGRPVDPLHPGGAAGMTMQFVVGRHARYRPHPAPRPSPTCRRTARSTTRTSAPSAPSPTRRSRTRPPRRRSASTGSIRPRTCSSITASRPTRSSTSPAATCRSRWIPKVAWALAHPERFPVEVATAAHRGAAAGPGHRAARRAAGRRRAGRHRAPRAGRSAPARRGHHPRGGFLTLRGRRLQTTRWSEQLGFWGAEEEVGAYHMVYEVSPGTFR